MKWFVVQRFSDMRNDWFYYAAFAVHIDGENYLTQLQILDPWGQYRSTLEDTVTL